MSRYLGLLASLLGDGDAAERHFEAALGLNERMGARPWLARAQNDYARLLRSRGDTARAQELSREAEASHREIGAAPVVFGGA